MVLRLLGILAEEGDLTVVGRGHQLLPCVHEPVEGIGGCYSGLSRDRVHRGWLHRLEASDCRVEGRNKTLVLHQQEVVRGPTLSGRLANGSDSILILPNRADLSLNDSVHFVFDQSTRSRLECGCGGLGLADFDTLASDSTSDVFLIRIYSNRTHIILPRARVNLKRDDLLPTLGGVGWLLQVSVRKTLLC